MARVPGAEREPKVIVVMPAYNAELTVEKTVRDIPPGSVDEIILVDDKSRDRTVEVARSLGLTVIAREVNGGYGANQKTCYTEALRAAAPTSWSWYIRIISTTAGWCRSSRASWSAASAT